MKRKEVGLQIGNEPNQRVFRSKQGGDKFLVLDKAKETCTLYVTVETLVSPRRSTLEQYEDTPYYRAHAPGILLYILREVSSKSYEDANVPGEANAILAEMEEQIEAL